MVAAQPQRWLLSPTWWMHSDGADTTRYSSKSTKLYGSRIDVMGHKRPKANTVLVCARVHQVSNALYEEERYGGHRRSLIGLRLRLTSAQGREEPSWHVRPPFR